MRDIFARVSFNVVNQLSCNSVSLFEIDNGIALIQTVPICQINCIKTAEP